MEEELGKSRAQKVGSWVFGVSLFFLISFFLAPATLGADSVPRLSGRANAFDYAQDDGWGSWGNGVNEGGIGHNQPAEGLFSWTQINPYAGFIYSFGDLNCHQKYERSWEINGNQMPVCTRDVGIFLGLAIGGWLFSRRGSNRWTITDSFLSVLGPKRLDLIYESSKRKVAAAAIVGISVLPIAIDGFTQMLTSYESTNPVRLITGGAFGVFLGLLIAAMFSAKPSDFDGRPELVRLPGRARLVKNKEEE
ncbi:MAG: DUF2085 domain-containing protein [Candidatus Poseidoniales archaeon]|jgi:uncharacterized membrane protein